jgi:RNA polymerase sigma-70 factor (ECF subfamily)
MAQDETSFDDLFRAHRRLLWGLSYRLTGCAADAEDVVQDTFARAMEREPALGGDEWRPWLVRVATNRALDVLRRRKRRGYAGAWLPSPVPTGEGEDALAAACDSGEGPEARYERAESMSFAFLVALEALSARQRAVLLFRDVFDFSAREAAEALGISEENVRITHHRARRAMAAYHHARCLPTDELRRRIADLLGELLRCLVAQDAAGLEKILASSVRAVTDGGGEFNALHAPLDGRVRVATLLLRVARRRSAGSRVAVRTVNGLPALVIEYARSERRQAPRAVLRCEMAPDGRIGEVHVVLASRKLTAVPRV